MILALRDEVGAMVNKVHEITAQCFLIYESFEGSIGMIYTLEN